MITKTRDEYLQRLLYKTRDYDMVTKTGDETEIAALGEMRLPREETEDPKLRLLSWLG